jgi:prefoldin subunit 5
MSPKKTAEQMIEELAISIGRGFAAAASRDDVKGLEANIQKDLEDLRNRIDKVAFNTSGLERPISTIEDRVIQLAHKAGLQFN